MNQFRVEVRVLNDLWIIEELLCLVDGIDREIGVVFMNGHGFGQDLPFSRCHTLRGVTTYPSNILEREGLCKFFGLCQIFPGDSQVTAA